MTYVTCDTSGVNLSNARRLEYPDLRHGNLCRKTLVGADLTDVYLRNANLTDVNMRNVRLVNADLQDAILVGVNLEDATLRSSNLAGANFKDSRLVNTKLVGAIIDDAVFDGAKLQGATFYQSTLVGASFKDTLLQNVNFEEADLTGADLTGADLTGANFSGASLTGVNLTRAIGIGTKAGEITFAESILWPIVNGEIELDMDYWHRACGTAHCIAGLAFPDLKEPGQKASLLYPTLAQYFYAPRHDALRALRLVAAGELSVFPD